MPVAAGYNDIRGLVVAGADKAFAEPIKVSCLRGGMVDPDRPPIEIEAVLRVGGGNATNMAGGFAQSWRTQLAAGKSELHIDQGKYPNLTLRYGDAIRALSRPGQPWFEVTRVDDRGENRLVLELGEK